MNPFNEFKETGGGNSGFAGGGGGFTEVTSEDEMYITFAFHLGLGLLLPLSDDFFLYASGEGTFGYYYRPDLKFTNSGGSVTYESASAWPFGFSWSAGFLFSNGMTLGYRYYSATSKYSEKYTVSGDLSDV